MTRFASRRRRAPIVCSIVGLAWTVAFPMAVQAGDLGYNSTGEAIVHADEHPENWLTYGRTYSEQRYSPLEQINTSNVGSLKLAWSFDLDTNRGQEGTPLVVNGVLFTTTNWSKVKALDAATGKLLWEYDPHVPGDIGKRGCCDTVNRGAAYWDGKIYFGTYDGRLVALDAKTGKEVWAVNTIPKDADLGDVRSYTITGAPRIAKGRVLIGNGGAEFGTRGFVSAFDAETGNLAWRFFTVPNPKGRLDHAPSDDVMQKAVNATWSKTGAWTRQGGGGTVWDSIVYDPVTNLIYLGVGNGSPWNYKYRSEGKGDNLFLGSIVAVNADTGKYVWHFQETPMDQWDYTSVQQIMTLDLPINGEKRHVIVHAPKNGFFYILDAKTGEFLSGKNYTYVNWAKGLDPKTGRPIFVEDAFYTKTGNAWYGIPGDLGGHSFHAMAYSPQTGLVYIPQQQVPFNYAPDDTGFKPHADGWNLGLDMTKIGVKDTPIARRAFIKDTGGSLLAWDPVHQKEAFRVDHKGPWNGGILATGGGLLFQGLANGEFHAYDAKDGKNLFHFAAQTGIVAPPITYSVAGKQYIAVLAGWGGAYPLIVGGLSRTSGWTVNHSRVLVFALDGTASLPPQDDQGFVPVKPPTEYDKTKVNEGFKNYATYCAVCHGDSAESGGVLPDLRWVGELTSADMFNDVVGKGQLTEFGMDKFSDSMNPQEIDSIRQYLIKRANDTYDAEVAARKNPRGVPAGPIDVAPN